MRLQALKFKCDHTVVSQGIFRSQCDAETRAVESIRVRARSKSRIRRNRFGIDINRVSRRVSRGDDVTVPQQRPQADREPLAQRILRIPRETSTALAERIVRYARVSGRAGSRGAVLEGVFCPKIPA